MKSKTNGSIQKAGEINHVQREGPDWVLVAGGVLLSTLSVRLGCKLKQMFDMKKQSSTSKAKRTPGACELHSNLYRFNDQTNCYCCVSGIADGGVDVKQAPRSSLSKSDEPSLLLARIPGPESSKENSGVMWTSSPDRLEDPRAGASSFMPVLMSTRRNGHAEKMASWTSLSPTRSPQEGQDAHAAASAASLFTSSTPATPSA